MGKNGQLCSWEEIANCVPNSFNMIMNLCLYKYINVPVMIK